MKQSARLATPPQSAFGRGAGHFLRLDWHNPRMGRIGFGLRGHDSFGRRQADQVLACRAIPRLAHDLDRTGLIFNPKTTCKEAAKYRPPCLNHGIVQHVLKESTMHNVKNVLGLVGINPVFISPMCGVVLR